MSKILTTLIMLGIAAGVFFVYTKPTYDKVDTLKSEIAQFDGALDKSKEMQELKRSLLSRYNTFTSEQLNRLTRLLPDHVDNVRLVLDLDSLASRYGMAVQNVVINRDLASLEQSQTVIGTLSAQATRYDSLTLQFATRGTYPNFMTFLNDLESSLRIVDLVGLTIDPEPIVTGTDEAGEDVAPLEPVYRYSDTLRTYWPK